MKAKIDSDEWYPVYELHELDSQFGAECEVDSETVARWKRIESEFDIAQKEMRDALKAATGNDRV